jgi:hypothetical protein
MQQLIDIQYKARCRLASEPGINGDCIVRVTDRHYIDWAWAKTLRNHEKIMLMELAFRADDAGEVRINSIMDFARQLKLTRVSVYRSLTPLLDQGLITRDGNTFQLDPSANCAAA